MYSLILILISMVFEPLRVGSIAELKERAFKEGTAGRLFTVYPVIDSFPADSTLFTFGILSSEELLVYVKCFQKVEISATVKKDDQDEIMSDDFVFLLLDTEGKGSTAYGFMVNPIKTRKDFMLTEGGDEAVEWDGKWIVEVNSGEFGYEVIYRIPFSSISFTKNPWGVKVGRYIAKRGEMQLSKTEGSIQSLSNIDRLNINFEEIYPVAVGEQSLRLNPLFYVRTGKEIYGDVSEQRITYGGTFRIRKGNSTVFDIVVSPDFSEMEADIQEISYSRRPIFFPEKRELFMEGGDLMSMPIALVRTRYFENIRKGAKFYTRNASFNSILYVIDDQDFDTVVFGKVNFSPFQGYKLGFNYIHSSPTITSGSIDFGGELIPKYGFGFSTQYSYRNDTKSYLSFLRLFRRSEFKGLNASFSYTRISKGFIMPFTPLYDDNIYEFNLGLEYGIPLPDNAFIKPRLSYYVDRELEVDTLVDRYFSFSLQGGKGPFGGQISFRRQDMPYLGDIGSEEKRYIFYGLAMSYGSGSYNKVSLQYMTGRYLGSPSYALSIQLKSYPLRRFNLGIDYSSLKAFETTQIIQLFGILPVVEGKFILKPYLGYRVKDQWGILNFKTVGYFYVTEDISLLFVTYGTLRRSDSNFEVIQRSISAKLCINL